MASSLECSTSSRFKVWYLSSSNPNNLVKIPKVMLRPGGQTYSILCVRAHLCVCACICMCVIMYIYVCDHATQFLDAIYLLVK